MRPQGRGSAAARAVLAAVLLGLIGWGVLNSALFHVREIRVVGLQSVARSEVLSLAGVREGTNLVTLAADDIAARLLRNPWIAGAEIDRDLPSTLVLSIDERRPVGWVDDTSGPVVIAGDGKVLERVQRDPGLPRIASWPEVLSPGNEVQGFGHQLGIVEAMSSWLLRRVSVAEIDDGDAVLELREGGVVIYGAPSEIRAKNEALERMLRWAEREGIAIESADVRVPSAPSLQPERDERPVDTPFS